MAETIDRVKLSEVPLSSLSQDDGNSNRGTGRGRRAVKESLERFGAGRSVVVDVDNKVIAGNKSLEAADELGMETALVVETTGDQLVVVKRTDLRLSERGGKARGLAVADNRAGELGLAYDFARLAEDLKACNLSDAFFTASEFDAISSGAAATGQALIDEARRQVFGGGIPEADGANDAPSGILEGVDPDAVPEDAPTRCNVGDLWALGEHRVLCGSSADPDAVRRLMGGAEADICFTSPPYAQQRDYTAKVGDWLCLMSGVFGVLPMADSGQVLVNLGLVHRDAEWQPYWEPWVAWMQGQGWRRFGWYVWDQGPGLPGDWNGRLAPAFEFVFHFNRLAEKARKTAKTLWGGHANHGFGLRQKDGTLSRYSHAGRPVQDTKIPDSVLRVMRHKARGIECEHPAVFPVELVVEVVSAFSDPGDVLYDPFSGSGTSILGAEKIGRRCFAVELSPTYVDIALTRWENATGNEARLLP